MKKIKKIIALVLVIAAAAYSCVTFSKVASAADFQCGDFMGINSWCNGIDAEPNFVNDTDGSKMTAWIVGIAINILNMLIDIANYVAVIMVMYGGFLYLTAGSNESQVAKGKKTITNAAIGVAIMTASSAVIGVVREVSGWFTTATAGFKAVANKAFVWAGLLAILMIIWGAVQYTTSAGDPGKMQKSKKIIFNALIGVVIIILAAFIVNVVITQADTFNQP